MSAMNTNKSRAEKFVSCLAAAVILAGFAADGIPKARHTVSHRPISMTAMARSSLAAIAPLRRAESRVAVNGSGRAGGSLQ
jgi:hypothetical protein